MTDRFEQYYLTQCAHRFAKAFSASSAVASQLSDWVEEGHLGFEWRPRDDDYRRSGVSVKNWAALRERLEREVENGGIPAADQLQKNACLLADYVGLNEIEAKIFSLAVRVKTCSSLEELFDDLVRRAKGRIDRVIAGMAGMWPQEVSDAFLPSGALLQSGLIDLSSSGFGIHSDFAVSERLLRALNMATGGISDITERMFDDPGQPDVGWEDFAHLGSAGDFAARLLKGAIREGARGVNLLFYGPPGTGKTEFCRVLAARVGANLHAVGETDGSGEEPSRQERIQQLRLGQKFLSRRNDTIVLFDEMEDLLSSLTSNPANMPLFLLPRMRGNISKVHMNRLLETNPVPTLWTCNDLDGFDPALLRRLTFTIEMRTPAEKVRARIWGRLAKNEGVALDTAICAKLARELPEPPALVANALRAASLGGGGVEDLRLAVREIAKATHGGVERAPNAPNDGPQFTPALINADTDILRLGARLTHKDAGRMVSLCLSGPPGSGKSVYARHLAKEMGLPVVQKRASDILSKWVGGSEKNIAAAFSEARTEGAFLIFDEADSLLSSRQMAGQSWEVSQVNEMLTWMESHPLPFACTTNLVTRLDPASLRRFTFKITLKPLSCAQLGQAFTQFFKLPAPSGLDRLESLTPGDFANVQRRAHALGVTDAEELLAELEKEVRAKPDSPKAFGFQWPQSTRQFSAPHCKASARQAEERAEEKS